MGGTVSMIARAALPLVLAVGLLAFAAREPVPVPAQEPVPTTESTESASDNGFFSGFNISDLISLVTAGVTVAAVSGLALLVVRAKDAEIDLANATTASVEKEKDAQIDLLEVKVSTAQGALAEERERNSQDVDRERRTIERLSIEHKAAIETMEKQLQLAKQQAGIDEGGQVSAIGTQLPDAVQEQLREMLSLINDMKASQDSFSPEEERPEPTVSDLISSGNDYFAAGDYKRALSEYERALEMQPENPTLHMNRGAALSHLDSHEEAPMASSA